MSTPYVFKRSGSWVMRYRETVNLGGELKTVQRARLLCAASFSKKDARDMAAKQLGKIMQTRPGKAELIVSLGDYVTKVYLPFAETSKRFHTAKTYKANWKKHFESRKAITGKLLVDVKTSDVYGWFQQIAGEDKNKKGEPLSRNTLKRLKSLLSGIFTHARCNGYLDTLNPVEGTLLPTAPGGKETFAYSPDDISAMLRVLPEPARTMVAVAAYTGLSRSEIRGLEWESFAGDELKVTRSIVGGKVQDTKTRARKAPVPLIPSLVAVLVSHRAREGSPITGPMFRTSAKTPLDPNNVLNDHIAPALKEAKIEWHGWHGFRRGLASNLHRAGVQDKIIQAILRHSTVAVTQACYIKTTSPDSVRAMASLDLCSPCALESTGPGSQQVQ